MDLETANTNTALPNMPAGEPRPAAPGVHAVAPSTKKPPKNVRRFIHTLLEWEQVKFDDIDEQVIVGTPTNAIIRPGTKNIVEGAEKSFKTTFQYPLALGLSCGHTVYPELPIARPVRTLYLHGEMTKREIDERQRSAIARIPAEMIAHFKQNFASGRDLDAHLVSGQLAITKAVKDFRPEVLFLDPWQSFIQGCDENSFKDVSKATSFIDKLIADYGVTVFLSVHLGKDHSRGARGHSTIKGWRDTLIEIERKGDQLATKVTVSPRWGTPPAPFKVEFRDGTMWPARLWTPQTTAIRKFVSENGNRVELSQIATALKLNVDAARKAADRAASEGALAHKKGTSTYSIFWDPLED